MIRLEGLSREFSVGGRPVRALDRVDLHVPRGAYASIMGPSGSGKSTLLNILGCLDRPTAGSYYLDDRDVSGFSESELCHVRRHDIGFVFQFFHLIPRLTAAQNIDLPMMFAGLDRRERKSRTEEALIAVGLEQRSSHRPDQLSGGERQRVAIARAIVLRPRVLLADEPTGNLDTASGDEIVALLEDLNHQGITLIMVTHDPAIGDRCPFRVRLVDGRVVSLVNPGAKEPS